MAGPTRSPKYDQRGTAAALYTAGRGAAEIGGGVLFGSGGFALGTAACLGVAICGLALSVPSAYVGSELGGKAFDLVSGLLFDDEKALGHIP